MHSVRNQGASFLLVLLCSAAWLSKSTGAQLVADGTTNVLDGISTNIAGSISIGTNGSFTLLVLPQFGLAQEGVGLDPVDQRRSARSRREQPLEDDQVRLLLENGLQRLDRFTVRKRNQFPFTGQLLAKGRREMRRGDDDGWHDESLSSS